MSPIFHRTFFLAALCACASAEAQTCRPNIKASAPDSRYAIDAAKGTVLDKKTGLMWKRCAEGQSGAGCTTGVAAYYNWGGALNQAAGSAHAGYKDWRLPNSKELASLVEEKCYGPAINLKAFPNTTSGRHWSSSPYVNNPNYAWTVFFSEGLHSSGGYHPDRNAVRLVRGGQ